MGERTGEMVARKKTAWTRRKETETPTPLFSATRRARCHVIVSPTASGADENVSDNRYIASYPTCTGSSINKYHNTMKPSFREIFLNKLNLNETKRYWRIITDVQPHVDYAIAESLNVVVERNKVARRGNDSAPRRIGLHDVEVCQYHIISNTSTRFSDSDV